MKPKEPKLWKYPRIYYQDADSFFSHETGRFRIIFPNGDCCFWGDWGKVRIGRRFGFPCWAKPKSKSPRGQLVLMRQYDKFRGWKRADFISEIK